MISLPARTAKKACSPRLLHSGSRGESVSFSPRTSARLVYGDTFASLGGDYCTTGPGLLWAINRGSCAELRSCRGRRTGDQLQMVGMFHPLNFPSGEKPRDE